MQRNSCGVNKGIVYKSNRYDVYENLAIENYLLHYCETEYVPILYLWQNQNAVVIGRNQNTYTECNIEYADDMGIQIARRTTGGGAVYHDLGNINFTIILPRDIYDPSRSTNVIVKALKRLDINVEITGRNDICIEGKKISGSAYYSNEAIGMHHGTILYQVNPLIMDKVLRVSKTKMSKHGVSSVKSRVGDIISVKPIIGIDDVVESVKIVYLEEYGITDIYDFFIDEKQLEGRLSKFRSDEWNLNKISDYEQCIERQFSWGNVRISFLFDGKNLKRVEISSDTLYVEQIENIRKLFNEILPNDDVMKTKLRMQLIESCNKEIVDDIILLVKEFFYG